MKVIGLFLLSMVLQSCNQPLTIPKQTAVAEKTSKNAGAGVGSAEFQRFAPVPSNPLLALDTATGQLCRTNPSPEGARGEDAKWVNVPFCRDIWMQTNAAMALQESTDSAQKQ